MYEHVVTLGYHIMKKTIPCILFLLPFLSTWAGAAETPKKEEKEPVIWGEMPAGAKTAYIGIHGGTVPVSLLSAGDGSPMIAMVGLTGNDFLNFLRTNGRLREEPVLPEFPAPQFAPEPVLEASVVSIPSDNATQRPIVPLQETASSPGTSVEGTSASSGNESSEVADGSTNATIPATPQTTLASTNAETLNSVDPSASQSAPMELAATRPPSPEPGVNATLLLAGTSGGDIPVIYATGRTFERMSLIPENWAPFGLTEKALSFEGEIKILAAPKKMPRNAKKSGKK